MDRMRGTKNAYRIFVDKTLGLDGREVWRINSVEY
jgi:hypothetical protein